jgi:1,5-anhydro-D-fructose reductase (1,5-anhydro-D-mannitol-forming)
MLNRVGIIGFGKMGQIRARAMESVGGFKIVKVFDINQPVKVDYSVAASAQDIIDDTDIDSVVICLPNFLIKPTIIAALQSGKNVFCEKPPAMNADEMAEIARVHADTGRTLMYGFNHRRHAAVIKMKEVVDSGDLGKVLWMRGRYGKSVDAEYFTGWRTDKELAGGGILLDQGIHMLDLFLHIGGSPFDEVQAMVSSLYWKTPGIEDNVFAMMRNRDTGMCAQLHSTMTQWRHLFSLEVFMERGSMVLNGLKTSSATYGEEILTVSRNRKIAPAVSREQEEAFHYPEDHSWEDEVAEFGDVINGKRTQEHGTVAHAIMLMDLVDAIYANDTYVSKTLYDDLQGHDKI